MKGKNTRKTMCDSLYKWYPCLLFNDRTTQRCSHEHKIYESIAATYDYQFHSAHCLNLKNTYLHVQHTSMKNTCSIKQYSHNDPKENKNDLSQNMKSM